MNTSVGCTASNCVYNMSGLCSATNINVTGKTAHTSMSTACDTFDERGLKNSIADAWNTNVMGEFAQVFNSNSIVMNPSIRCEAENCIHNKENVCIANNIYINGIDALKSGGTKCETFEEGKF